jgi:hypothetical protein
MTMIDRKGDTGFLKIIGLIILVLLSSFTMGHALEIHHLFAEVDHDGHEHSEFDLCQWVQSHTAGSLIGQEPPLLALHDHIGLIESPLIRFVTLRIPIFRDSRGPPSSLTP